MQIIYMVVRLISYLPYGEFKWLNQKETDKFDVNLIGENSSVGHMSDVDLEYPDQLHELHNDYPLTPEQLQICHNMLSNYCSNVSNIVPNLGNKSRDVLHYKNPQFCLSIGMKLVSVRRVSKFKQSENMLATVLKKIFFKLMNNSVYGKTMENLRKRIKVRLVNNAKDYKKYVSRPSFVSEKIFNKNLVAIHEIKPVLTLDKQIYVGFTILDLSKLLMYEFHYKYIKIDMIIMLSYYVQT